MMANTQYLDYEGLQKYHRNIKQHFAPLDEHGIIPAANLPSYVDDVLEFNTLSDFPSTGESGKIYVTLDTNLTYRWTGSKYIEISSSLALGTTSSTAFPGDRGATLETKVEKLENVSNSLPSDIIDGVESTHNEDNFTIEFTTSQKDQSGIYQNGIGSQTIIPTATNKTCGLMSKDDKKSVDSYKDHQSILEGVSNAITDQSYLVNIEEWDIQHDDSDVKLHTKYTIVDSDEITYQTQDLTINAATSEKAGVMSAEDKKKLDSLSTNTSNIIFFDGYVESANTVHTSPDSFSGNEKVVYVASAKSFAVYDADTYYVGKEQVFDSVYKKLKDYSKVDNFTIYRPFKNTFYISTENYTMYVSDNAEDNILHIINTKDITSQQINSL